MTREIKFRAWDKLNNNMLDWTQLRGATFEDGKAFDFKHFNIDRLDFMQYTGLKDKNGKEIYEGDILNNSDIRVVEWIGEISDGDSNIAYGYDFFGYHCKVIGNIYENPDLLSNNSKE